MLLTIVIVARKDPVGLRETLKSLYRQSKNILIKVIISKSDRETYEVAKEFKKILNFDIDFDREIGVYHAMNIGLRNVKTNYVWFLNAGDLPASSNTIGQVISQLDPFDKEISYCGKTVVLNKRNKIRRIYAPNRINLSACLYSRSGLSHPAFIYSTKKLIEIGGFDTKYRISADTKSMAQIVQFSKLKLINLEIAKFRIGGISSKKKTLANFELYKIRKEIGPNGFQNKILSIIWFTYRQLRLFFVHIVDL